MIIWCGCGFGAGAVKRCGLQLGIFPHLLSQELLINFWCGFRCGCGCGCGQQILKGCGCGCGCGHKIKKGAGAVCGCFGAGAGAVNYVFLVRVRFLRVRFAVILVRVRFCMVRFAVNLTKSSGAGAVYRTSGYAFLLGFHLNLVKQGIHR